jgi:hypothetical protein
MPQQNAPTDVRLPAEADALVALLEEVEGRELTEQERNLAITQAKLIGDL